MSIKKYHLTWITMLIKLNNFMQLICALFNNSIHNGLAKLMVYCCSQLVEHCQTFFAIQKTAYSYCFHSAIPDLSYT